MSFEYPVYSNKKPEDAPYARQIDAEGDGKDLYLVLPKGNEQELNQFPTWPQDYSPTPGSPELEVSTRRDFITRVGLGAVATVAVIGGATTAYKQGLFEREKKKDATAPEQQETQVRYVEVEYGNTAWAIIESLYPGEDTSYILNNYTSVIRQNGEEDTNLDVLYGGDQLKITYVDPERTPEP